MTASPPSPVPAPEPLAQDEEVLPRNPPWAPRIRWWRKVRLAEIIAALALMVAAASAAFSGCQVTSLRNHYRLSVRPQLIVKEQTTKNEGAGWSIENKGLGPAQVIWAEVKIDNHAHKIWSDAAAALDLGVPVELDYAASFVGTVPINAGEDIKVFWFAHGPSTTALLDKSDGRDHISRVTISFCYCSIYEGEDGQCWLASNKVTVPTAGSCEERPAVPLGIQPNK